MGRASSRRRGGQPGAFGILLIDKPAGPTSHDLVAWVRWALRERTVGHCGTLDPPATGLLVVCVGEATKLVEHLTGIDKRYRARFVLGRSTTTADAEGETIATVEVPPGTEALALASLSAMLGPLELPPPAFSAVKVQGRRAHELARAGEHVELPPRPMAVHELEIEGHGRERASAGAGVWIDVELSVAKGTYVRSLAQELGRRLGLPAHMASLRRLSCGELSVDDPLAVNGLVPVLLPPIEGRAPKWRVELPADETGDSAGDQSTHGDGAGDSRARTGAQLRAAMSEPWRWLPFEVSDLPSEGAHTLLVARLLQGQRLRADSHNCGALGIANDDGPCALVDRAAGRMIILRRELSEHQGRVHRRLAPSRVLRFEPRPLTAGPTI